MRSSRWSMIVLGASLAACGGGGTGGSGGMVDPGDDGGMGGMPLDAAVDQGPRDQGPADQGGEDQGAGDLGGDQGADLGPGDLGADMADDLAVDMPPPPPCDPLGVPFGGGLGTEASPHQLCTAAQLDAIRDPGNEALAYVLEADVDLADLGSPWAPLPSFAGTLDGGGHVVFGLVSTGGSDFALIDALSGAVRDLVLADVDVRGGSNLSTFALELVEASGARLEDVLATGRIELSGQGAGGVVGTLRAGTSVEGAAFVGEIVQTSSGANGFVGGVARAVLAGATLRQAFAAGTITSGRSKLGGVVGDLTGTLEECVSSVRLETGGGTGGIMGTLIGDAVVRDCIVRGSLADRPNNAGIYGLRFSLGAPTFERVVFAGRIDGGDGEPIGVNIGAATYQDVFYDADAVAEASGVARAIPLAASELRSATEARLAALATPTWVRDEGELPALAFEASLFPETIPCNADAAPFGGGLGNRVLPFIVCTPAHLEALRTLTDTPSAILAGDVDLSGVTFAPLPSWDGVLDGNGFAIQNWSHGGTTSDDVAFVETLGGTLRNLALEDVDLFGRARLAALVGEAVDGALMSGVRVTGMLEATSSGLAGIVRTMRAGSRLEDAHIDASLTASGGAFHGGVVSAFAAGAVAERVLAEGTLTVTGSVDKVGGFASDLNGTLRTFVIRSTLTSARGQRVGGSAAVLGAGAVVEDGFVATPLDLAGGPTLVGGLFGARFGAGTTPTVDRVIFAGAYPTRAGRPVLGEDDSAVTFTDVFWDVTKTGVPGPTAPGTTGFTTAELQDPATYDGWPSPPWTIALGSYPSPLAAGVPGVAP